MRKPAESSYPLQELIRERWSPLAFTGEAIDDETLGALFEAARWAPSCYNEQPWRFIVARREDGDAFERLADCLVPANRAWAKNASVLAIAVAADAFERNGKPNAWSWHDVGLATAQLILQAQSMGVSAHVMAGFDAARARETLGIPEGFTPVSAMALGPCGDAERLDEGQRQREASPRQRRPLSSVAFRGLWDEPLF